MLHLIIFLSLAKIVKGQHNLCGGAYEKEPFDEFLESASYERYTLHPYNGKFEFEASFCVQNQDGLIATISDAKYQFFLLLEIKNHEVLLEIYISPGLLTDCLWSLGHVIPGGQKHTASITLHPKEKLLEGVLFTEESITKGKKSEINITTCAPSTVERFQHLEIGAETSSSGKGTRPVFLRAFIGCMTVRVHGKRLIHVANLTNSAAVFQCSTFQAQCHEDCRDPFQSNGRHCICPSTSKLNLLEEKCEPSCDCVECHNGGSCILVTSSNRPCQCTMFYEGDFCEIETDPCDKLSCQNGGFCKLHDDGHVGCNCAKFYAGRLCEILTDPCEKTPCQNGGTILSLLCNHREDTGVVRLKVFRQTVRAKRMVAI